MRKIFFFLFLSLLPIQLFAGSIGNITTVNIKSNPTSTQIIFILDQKTRGVDIG